MVNIGNASIVFITISPASVPTLPVCLVVLCCLVLVVLIIGVLICKLEGEIFLVLVELLVCG